MSNKSKEGESYKWIREVVEEVVGVKQEYYTHPKWERQVAWGSPVIASSVPSG